MTEEQKPIDRKMTFEDIAALTIATALYIAKDDPTIIDTIGATAERIKENFVDETNEPETA
jgi:DNA primase